MFGVNMLRDEYKSLYVHKAWAAMLSNTWGFNTTLHWLCVTDLLLFSCNYFLCMYIIIVWISGLGDSWWRSSCNSLCQTLGYHSLACIVCETSKTHALHDSVITYAYNGSLHVKKFCVLNSMSCILCTTWNFNLYTTVLSILGSMHVSYSFTTIKLQASFCTQ